MQEQELTRYFQLSTTKAYEPGIGGAFETYIIWLELVDGCAY